MILRKNIKTIVLLFFLAAFVIYFFLQTPIYLEWKIQIIEERFIDLVESNHLGIQELASTISTEAQISDVHLWYDRYHCNYPPELKQQLSDFLSDCPVRIDDVSTAVDTLIEYPKNSCIFQHTIQQFNSIYAWVELVYVPYEDLENPVWYKNASRSSIYLTEGWYILVNYGY